jgi:hypothetical protein
VTPIGWRTPTPSLTTSPTWTHTVTPSQ